MTTQDVVGVMQKGFQYSGIEFLIALIVILVVLDITVSR